MWREKQGGIEEYLGNNIYRVFVPLESYTDIEIQRELVRKFFTLLHGKGCGIKLILAINEGGSSFYISLDQDPILLKTVFRNMNESSLIKTSLDFKVPNVILSSYQINRKYFLGPENSTVDFFEYLLSYRSRLSSGSLLIVLDLRESGVPLRFDYSGFVFKFKINIFVQGDLPDLENIVSLISNYWSNRNTSLKFKKIRMGKMEKGFAFLNDRNVHLAFPYPGKILEISGIATRFIAHGTAQERWRSITIGMGLANGKTHGINLFEKNGQSTLLLGETGSGKSTLIISMFFQLLKENRPIIIIDPTGDTAKEIIKRIDRDSLKRTIYIDPVETPVSMNLLDIQDAVERNLAISRIAEDTIQVLKNVTEAESGVVGGLVGSKIEEIVRSSIFGLARIRGASILDISYIITKPGVRKYLRKISDDPEFIDFLDELENFSQDDVSSTRRTISFLKTNPVLKSMLCSRYPLFRISDAIKKRNIVIVNGERGLVGERVSTFILSSIISMVWISLQGRGDKESVFLFCDEFQDYINSSFEDMLILGRKENLNLFMATTHLSAIPTNVRDSIMANTKNFILFRLSPSDAREFSEKFSTEKNELMNMGTGVAFLRSGNVSELTAIHSSMPGINGLEKMIIEKSRSYISKGTEISPVLDIREEALSLFLDLQFLKYMHMGANVSNIASIREKIPPELKAMYDDDVSFLKEIIEKLHISKMLRFQGDEIIMEDLWGSIVGDDEKKRIIEKLISLGLIVRVEKSDPLVLLCIPYSANSFNPLNRKFFRAGINTASDISIFEEKVNECDQCYSYSEFLKLNFSDELLEIIMGVCLYSTDGDKLITTAHRISEAIRSVDSSLGNRYGQDLERLVRKTLIENNLAMDGERIYIENSRVRTLVVDLKNARGRFREIKTDVNLKIE